MAELDEEMDRVGIPPDPPRLYGRALRMVLVDLLATHHTMTMAQLVAQVAAGGYPIEGRLSKTISDALRWEVARGRVVRVSRGVYRIGTTPTTTARRIRLFARRCRAWIVATTRGQVPPPTPVDRRASAFEQQRWPGHLPPWFNTAWLWTS